MTDKPIPRQASKETNVKTALRVIEIIEIYAKECRPLALSELAKLLNAPMSSCLALIRTLVSLGYLYETNRRAGYYPTGRLLAMAQKISAADPILERIYPSLEELRNITNETVVIGKLHNNQKVLYLEVLPSANPIHYVAMAGEQKEINANSLGKALFSTLDEDEKEEVLNHLPFHAFNTKTIAGKTAFLADIEQSLQRGWFGNFGESIPDVGALAWPVKLSGSYYAISIAGPLYRIQANLEDFAQKLRVISTFIEKSA